MNQSSSNSAIPVIAGLTVGIGLIVLFSISLRPSSDDEIRTKVRNLPEVKRSMKDMHRLNRSHMMEPQLT